MFNKLYIYGGIAILFSFGITYHVIKVSSLNNKIHDLENKVLVGQHRYINCEQNITTLNGMIDKQNEKLKSIEDEFKKNLTKFSIWSTQDDSKKYNNKVLNIFNANSTSEIAKQLNQIDFINEISK